MAEIRVLVPLDGSPLSESALSAVEALTAVASLKVRLVSVLESVQGLTAIAEDEMKVRESNLLHAYLNEVTAKVAALPGVVAAESHVVAGDPVEMIADQAAEFQPDLLVISTHGRSGLSRWRIGSVADAVVRSGISDCLVVGPHARLRLPVRSILVPLDGSARSERALIKGEMLAKAFGSALHLVRVIDLPVSVAERNQDAFDSLSGYGNEYLERVQKTIDKDISVCTAVRFGSPAERLLDYVAGREIDLVVMTSKGRGGVARSVLGSVAGRVIGGLAAVLTLKTEQEG